MDPAIALVNAPLSKTTVRPVATKLLPVGTTNAVVKPVLPRAIPVIFLLVNSGYVDVYVYAESQLAELALLEV
jgi:hypothetical protein